VGLSRSTYYYKTRKKPPDMELAEKIEEIALDFPSYGYRRITAELNRQGLKVNHKRVLRIMRNKNLLCRVRKAFKATTDSSHGFKKYPNLIRGSYPLQDGSAVAC
jgi:putative transposase